MSRWTGRGWDQVWFWFFVIHIPITFAMDLQAIYPPSLIANTPLPGFLKWYLSWSRDPIMIGGASGKREYAWLNCFFYLEAFVQVPSFILGAIGLWRNDKRIYPLMLFYGASTATTVVPTIYYALTEKALPPYSQAEKLNMLATYVPFLLIPLGMAIDVGLKLVKLVQVAEARKSV